MYYLNYFIIFSVLGHLMESILFSKSGIFLSYWTPIYGIGSIIILLIYKYIDKFKFNKIKKATLLFFTTSILLSILEATGGYLIKWIFNKELWNYSNLEFNIGKYTSLEMSLIWGLGSLLLIYILKPLIDKIISKVPKILTYILSLLFIIDVIITIIMKI